LLHENILKTGYIECNDEKRRLFTDSLKLEDTDLLKFLIEKTFIYE